MESSPSFSPSFSFSPPTNDPFTRFLSIRTPLRGECWITLRKSVLDFLSRVTKQTLNRENSSCFSLFFGFCYSLPVYTLRFHSLSPFRRREGGVCTSAESFGIGSFISPGSYLLPRLWPKVNFSSLTCNIKK